MHDPLGAFCSDQEVRIEGKDSKALSDLTFAAKDVFDIAGFQTGAGNPDWLRTHSPAKVTASAVQRLLDAGAALAGKTHTDELTYSLNGENYHYGTPVNPNAPGRIPGGSSSGSASAVAGGLVDFALGTDTGGSVRLPASNCGIYGFRPSHGLVANDHVVPLAPSFDTVGWFARDAKLLERVGKVLLAPRDYEPFFQRFLLATDAMDLVFTPARRALDEALGVIREALGPIETLSLYGGSAEKWMNTFRFIQGAEVWQSHGEWISANNPSFGPEIHERFRWAASIAPEQARSARLIRSRVTEQLDELLVQTQVFLRS
jgi:amidase